MPLMKTCRTEIVKLHLVALADAILQFQMKKKSKRQKLKTHCPMNVEYSICKALIDFTLDVGYILP